MSTSWSRPLAASATSSRVIVSNGCLFAPLRLTAPTCSGQFICTPSKQRSRPATAPSGIDCAGSGAVQLCGITMGFKQRTQFEIVPVLNSDGHHLIYPASSYIFIPEENVSTMMRILLFLATNLAVVLIASITLSLFGFNGFMAANGVDLNLNQLLVFCAVFGFAGSLFSLFISKWMAKMSTGTQIITQPRTRHEQWLLQTVEQLSRDAGIKMPEVGIFPAYEANAFATGWNKNDALVAVSQGLLERFSPDEVKAVLAHEIGHVANGDMVTLALVQGVVNTFVMFFARIIGNFVDKVIFKTENGQGIAYYITTIFAELVLGFLASAIVMWFSRKREFRADDAGARLAGTDAMIGALQRLRSEQGVPVNMPDSLTAFGINAGLKKGLAGLFMSHPPLEQRIEALRRRG
ncbi:Protease HtpX [Pseudomonas syringae pv. viburni]|uniref:Protease HtpX n=1 Tax=Pseudomonas syringae pv. viburni TaxID=251703 RepID=A0A0Q0F755_9PSED|nr:Protease HtpX [Pseudomonas syringae pv. viburni]